MFNLPKTATAPFCPSEIQGTIKVDANASFFKKLLLFIGPGLLVSVGYMDPGNWATDIAAGAHYGYSLLFVVLFASLAAVVLQALSLRLGIVAEKDLAQLSAEAYRKPVRIGMWLLAELAIIATDVAEVLGCALAFKLLFGCSLIVGIILTVFDTLIVLGLKGRGFRKIEAIILGLVATIGLCFIIELVWFKPYWPDVLRGFIPSAGRLNGVEPWYIAVGIIGATVMPHNLYLHSSIAQTRKITGGLAAKAEALRLSLIDTSFSLFLAFFVNAAILILAGAAFFATANRDVSGIDDAFRILSPVVGSKWAGFFFGVALLAAGQSSTFTGTIAGQIVMDGFMKIKLPCWQRRLLTRGLALVPALIGVLLLGDQSVGALLIMSQVVLSFQLPFAIYPLITLSSDKKIMGEFSTRGVFRATSWLLLLVILAANCSLIYFWVH